jgi:hypothetical protein
MLTRSTMDQRTALATQQAKLKRIESEFKALTDVPPEQLDSGFRRNDGKILDHAVKGEK